MRQPIDRAAPSEPVAGGSWHPGQRPVATMAASSLPPPFPVVARPPADDQRNGEDDETGAITWGASGARWRLLTRVDAVDRMRFNSCRAYHFKTPLGWFIPWGFNTSPSSRDLGKGNLKYFNASPPSGGP